MSDLSDKFTVVEKRARIEPKRLEDIATMKLIHMLIEHIIPRILRLNPNIDWIGGSDAIREEALSVRDWIYDTLSSSVADNIQKLILQSITLLMNEAGLASHPNLKFLRLLLLHPKCRYLSSTWGVLVMIGDVADMLKSLTCLEHIKWLCPYIEDKFVENLKYCNRLKVFVCTAFCNDMIIKVLSQNCPLLSQLDIDGSEHVTDESTHYIKQMKSLMKCSIIGTSITIEGAMRILKNCTQLHKLNMHHSMYEILKGFEDVDDPIQLPLRTVTLNGNSITRSHTLLLLKKYCPFITHVVTDGRYHLIEPHCRLVNVERLTIGGYFSVQPVDYPGFHFSTLNTWLIGDRINVVNIICVSLSDEDLVKLSNVCPNITELCVTVRVFFNGNGYVSLEHHTFQKLQILKFVRIGEGDFRSGDARIFKILLSYSTMMTHVDIIGLDIDDDVVDTIFKTNQMPDLEYWQIRSTRCTCRTLYSLFNMCPMLKFIGQLSTWNIHPDEVEKIESFMRKFNFDFDIDKSRSDTILQSIKNRSRDLLRPTPM